MNTCPICGSAVPNGAFSCPACGSPLSTQTLAPGTTLQGKYRIDSVLGQGGFGITYAATQLQLGSRLAIKEMFPSGTVRQGQTVLPPGSFDAPSWQQARHDFTEEARLLARFNHPDIVRVLDLFEERGTAYMVMERLEGESLQARIDRTGPLSAPQVQDVAERVTRALQVVHSAGLLHRDIKPDNIFLEASGRVVLIDFGSARMYSSGQTIRHTRLVTPGYAPMEQYSSAAKFGPYTDIYALGATLHHALTGQMPPSAPDLLNGTPLPALPNAVQGGLRRAIMQAMAVRVADRPQDAAALLTLLHESSAPARPSPSSPPAAPPRPVPPSPSPAPTPPPQKRRGFPVWLVVLGLAGAGIYKVAVAPAAETPAETSASASKTPSDATGSGAATSQETGTTGAQSDQGAVTPSSPSSTDAPAAQANQNAVTPSSPSSTDVPAAQANQNAVTPSSPSSTDVPAAQTNQSAVTPPSPSSTDPSTGSGNAPPSQEAQTTAPVTPPPADVPAATPTEVLPPSEDPITDNEVTAFVDNYLAAGAQDALDQSMNLYADRVEYFDRGVQPKSVLKKDKAGYFKRWPARIYQRVSEVTTLAEGRDSRAVRFNYSYDLTRPGKRLTGQAYTDLSLIKAGGQLYITGEKGTIFKSLQHSITTAPAPSEAPPAQAQQQTTNAVGAPKYLNWSFTSCQDADTGAQQESLSPGRLQYCDLVIETVPNGAVPAQAVFNYELEYQEGGVTQKFTVDTPDVWPSSGGLVTRFRQEGSNLIFTLPLVVRKRDDRVYTQIDAIGKITFDNGSEKNVYGRLPIQ